MNQYIYDLKLTGKYTWGEIAKMVKERWGCTLSSEACRKRYETYKDHPNVDIPLEGKDVTTEYNDGTIEAQKIVEYNKEIFGDKQLLLEYLGYSPKEWEFVFISTSTWEQQSKDDTKQLYAVKFKVRPRQKQISLEDALEVAKQVFESEIPSLDLQPKYQDITLDDDRLMEIPAIELHYGKRADYSSTGQDYNTIIARSRFYTILENAIDIQRQEQCGTALVTIGNDFFNSDTTTNTTTKGTPQNNELSWREMFHDALEMYKDFFIKLREHFNKIDVRLCMGNHDKMASFYLYMALSCYFKDDDILDFSENYKEYQCYMWGDCAIFFGHGDNNLKRLIGSIPCEFYKEWGASKYRELHLGHLHKEMTVDDNNGLITRRIGSPSGTDEWHYQERFIGATQKHQIFIWDRETGLQSVQYVNFNNNCKKLLKKKK